MQPGDFAAPETDLLVLQFQLGPAGCENDNREMDESPFDIITPARISKTRTAIMHPSPLAVGAQAPDFELPRDGGGTLRLSAFRGRPVVLYFYPKDDTTACTAEAVGFSALADRFARAGVSVIGVSPDSPKKHDKFKARHRISVALVSDEAHAALEAYGVWGEKTMFGRKYMGVIRTTFLIDADGRVARVWPRVSVAGHPEDVLAAAQALVAADR